MSIPYFQKLKDPRWQKLRLEVFNRDNFTCKVCGEKEKTLNVHHLSYNGEPWEQHIDLLITMCEDCHKYETDYLKETEKELIKMVKDSGFMAQDISDLGRFISDMEFIHCVNVQFSAIEWFIKKHSMKSIMTDYFKSLEKNDHGASF